MTIFEGQIPVETGGIVTVLKAIAILSPIGAFLLSATGGLSAGAALTFVVTSAVGACFTWAFAAVIQLLREIAANTTR